MKVNVKVKYLATTGEVKVDTGGIAIPATSSILSHLTPKSRAALRRYWGAGYESYNIFQLIKTCQPQQGNIPISHQEWADAIAASIMFSMTNAGEEGNAEATAISGPAYMAIGDTIFRLSATGMAKPNAALQILRKSMQAKYGKEGEAIVAAAQANANTILQKAEEERQKAAKIRADLEAGNRVNIPMWISQNNLAVQFSNIQLGRIGIRVKFVVSIETFEYKWNIGGVSHRKVWTCAPNQKPVEKFAWVWISVSDGSYNVNAITLDPASGGQLPHMCLANSCFNLGQQPDRITTATQLNELGVALTRANKSVNFNSLLVAFERWDKRVQDMAPPALAQAIRAAGLDGNWQTAIRQVPAQHETPAPAMAAAAAAGAGGQPLVDAGNAAPDAPPPLTAAQLAELSDEEEWRTDAILAPNPNVGPITAGTIAPGPGHPAEQMAADLTDRELRQAICQNMQQCQICQWYVHELNRRGYAVIRIGTAVATQPPIFP